MNKLSITHNNGIATVTINNPPVNILTIELINEINEFVLSLKDNRDTKVVVFKSLHEQFFLAHLDLHVINGTQGGQAASIEFNHMILWWSNFLNSCIIQQRFILCLLENEFFQ